MPRPCGTACAVYPRVCGGTCLRLRGTRGASGLSRVCGGTLRSLVGKVGLSGLSPRVRGNPGGAGG